ncbi:hypothetical protein CEXT_538721 [Caerostris extrusa]|uniref:Uncharacterized protein n=1 Tax=Caerostris extrusa TaxID=172846 RepID=A0AAV4Y3C9_CAEEX|nr:hypothetical protein CEXT_538721 [Caerostris extrusa]
MNEPEACDTKGHSDSQLVTIFKKTLGNNCLFLNVALEKAQIFNSGYPTDVNTRYILSTTVNTRYIIIITNSDRKTPPPTRNEPISSSKLADEYHH